MDIDKLKSSIKDAKLIWIEIEPFSGPSEKRAFRIKGTFQDFLAAASNCAEANVFVSTYIWEGAEEFIVEDETGQKVNLLKFEPSLGKYLFREGQAQSITFTALCGGKSVIYEMRADWLNELFEQIDATLDRWESKKGERVLENRVKRAAELVEERKQIAIKVAKLETDERFINLCLMPRVTITSLDERYEEVFPNGPGSNPDVRYEMRLLCDKIRLKNGKKIKKPIVSRE